MLKYKSFPIADEKEINAFLEENKHGVARDGVAYLDGRIIFMYSSLTREEGEQQVLASAIRTMIADARSSLATADHKVHSFKEMAARGIKDADKEVMKAKEEYEAIEAQIMHSIKILEEVEAGTWRGWRMPLKVERKK